MRVRTFAILFFSALWIAAPARSAEVRGRVVVTGRGDRPATTLVVYAESLEGRTPVQPKRATLAQRDKGFVPRVLAVPVGSTVDFPNDDPIFHNVFSLSPPAQFDLGLYRAGASKSRAFDQPATYRVFCNIHHQMTAVILVLPTSYIVEADTNGNYTLELPPGRYRITAWSERAQPATAEVSVSGAAAAVPDLTLDESKFVELPHKNKFGNDYAGYEQPKKKPN